MATSTCKVAASATCTFYKGRPILTFQVMVYIICKKGFYLRYCTPSSIF